MPQHLLTGNMFRATPQTFRVLLYVVIVVTTCAWCWLGLCESGLAAVIDEPLSAEVSGASQAAIEGLKPLAGLVGQWRGVGQPQRGSNRGAWTESTSIVWRFRASQTSLDLNSESGQLFDQIQFTWKAELPLTASIVLPDKQSVNCQLQVTESTDSKFVFLSEESKLPQYRCTVRQLSDIRATILLEKRIRSTGSFGRIAEVGYTRAGTRLASSGSGEKQCIVTGGLGTIAVKFEGKTFYVCCEGCKQAFDADTAGTVEEYRRRLAEQKAKPESQDQDAASPI